MTLTVRFNCRGRGAKGRSCSTALVGLVLLVVSSACSSTSSGVDGALDVAVEDDTSQVKEAAVDTAGADSVVMLSDADLASDLTVAPGTVVVTSDWTTFLYLLKPYGKLDEPGLGGFEYLISSKTGFDGYDQLINIGDTTTETTAIGNELGAVDDLSGTAFDFTITHVAGKHYAFALTPSDGGAASTLCWGVDCPAGSVSSPTLDGQPPITNYNGLQLQVRAQEIDGASTRLSNLQLSGLSLGPTSALLLDLEATPDTPSTIPIDPKGRVGQWILGPDLAVMDWTLSGTVTITRIDAATSDLSKVRFVVDFVTDIRLPIAGG